MAYIQKTRPHLQYHHPDKRPSVLEIAETIIAHDGEAARALMIQHVRIDGASMLDTIKKMDERL